MANKKTTIDGKFEIYSPYRSQCAKCRHFNRFEYLCVAFPKVIPDDILTGDLTHDKVLPGQVGDTVFTPLS